MDWIDRFCDSKITELELQLEETTTELAFYRAFKSHMKGAKESEGGGAKPSAVPAKDGGRTKRTRLTKKNAPPSDVLSDTGEKSCKDCGYYVSCCKCRKGGGE